MPFLFPSPWCTSSDQWWISFRVAPFRTTCLARTVRIGLSGCGSIERLSTTRSPTRIRITCGQLCLIRPNVAYGNYATFAVTSFADLVPHVPYIGLRCPTRMAHSGRGETVHNTNTSQSMSSSSWIGSDGSNAKRGSRGALGRTLVSNRGRKWVVWSLHPFLRFVTLSTEISGYFIIQDNLT